MTVGQFLSGMAVIAVVGGLAFAWWDTLLFRMSIRSALKRSAPSNDICGMKCPGGSEQRKCGCRCPKECVLNRGGQR